MGKSKNNNRSEIEYLRGENRRLRKRIREAEKQHLNITEQVYESEEPNEVVERKETCNDCGKGEVKTIDLGIRIIKECLLCGHREVMSGKEKKSP